MAVNYLKDHEGSIYYTRFFTLGFKPEYHVTRCEEERVNSVHHSLSALLQDHFAVQDLKIKWYIVEFKVLSYYAGRVYFLKRTYRLRGEHSQHPCVDPEQPHVYHLKYYFYNLKIGPERKSGQVKTSETLA